MTASLLGLRFTGALQPFELYFYDVFLRSRPDEGPDDRLVIIEINDQDIAQRSSEERMGPLSISDKTLAELLEKLKSYNPKVIGLDIQRPFETKLESLKKRYQTAPNLIAICADPNPEDVDPGHRNTEGASAPLSIPGSLIDQRVGFSNFIYNEDRGIIRRHLLQREPPAGSPCFARFSFSLRVASSYLNQPIQIVQTPTEEVYSLAGVNFSPLQSHTGGYQGIDDRGHQILLNYRTHLKSPINSFTRVTLTNFLSGQNVPFTADEFKKKPRIVLIGITAASRGDIFETPYSGGKKDTQGVIIHAQMISQILSAVESQRSLLWTWPQPIEWLWIGFWSLAGGMLALWLRSPLHLILATGIVLVILTWLCYTFLRNGGWIPFFPPVLAILATEVVVISYTTFQSWQTLRRAE